MFTLIGLLVFVGSVRGAFVPRIVNGENARIQDYPYQVSLEVKGRYICGGSIIGNNFILTAAHCIDHSFTKTRAYYSPSTLRIRAGTSIREHGGQVRAVSRICVHPGWGHSTFDNDVAVLVLFKPLVLNHKVQIVQLAVDNNQPIGSIATVTGWGLTENGALSEVLQKLDQEKVSDQQCVSSFGLEYNPLSQICYGDEPGKTSCKGDSGGPLVQNGVQVGIVSYSSTPCDGVHPVVYTKVSFYLTFIQNLIQGL